MKTQSKDKAFTFRLQCIDQFIFTGQRMFAVVRQESTRIISFLDQCMRCITVLILKSKSNSLFLIEIQIKIIYRFNASHFHRSVLIRFCPNIFHDFTTFLSSLFNHLLDIIHRKRHILNTVTVSNMMLTEFFITRC